jgi:hypothetical protein
LFIRRDIQIVLDAACVNQSDGRYKEPQIGQMRGRATALQRLTVPGRDEFKIDGDALGGTRGTTKQGDKQQEAASWTPRPPGQAYRRNHRWIRQSRHCRA